MLVVASVGRGPRRDQVVAACLAGAVVVVVGYASGIGLKTTAASGPAPSDQPPAQAAPAPQPVLPNGELPPPGAVQPMPPVPGGGIPPVDAPPPAAPVTDLPPGEVPPPTGDIPQPSGDPMPPAPPDTPPQTPPETPPPTGTPTCRPGAVQPVLDTVSGLPLVGGLTTGLAVTGPDGLLATLIGSCPAVPGQPAGSPAPAAIPSSGG
ncbi:MULTISPECIES: hypothetical protein [Amycolatopsis]|uniref:Uncharacterized protein n=1 Tax=Amycolatopsis dendrobii TaxID=2760662 RepID=A0A7W3ZG84_9PSEU|nr:MULTISPECIES: hypothetical protein [Amycolatopsis]MBB1159853.1 hypothetical protein [Amycolatopsis dendrobii]UKD59096.1 hypothetical protein L3Q65_21000 [Amycolatopsis sp. FU40]